MTELRIIEMAIKPPFKYFIQKDGCFGGGPLPEELCLLKKMNKDMQEKSFRR